MSTISNDCSESERTLWQAIGSQEEMTTRDSPMSKPLPGFRDEALLDNPIWYSLTTDHANLAIGADVGSGLARQYPTNIGPLAAFLEPTLEAYSDLARVIPENDHAVLLLASTPNLPEGWQLLRGGLIVQMICHTVPDKSPLAAVLEPLGPADFPEMMALASLTEPGPFREHTGQLGGFIGIRVDGRLAAMAGRRLAPTGFAEVSAVCTHPDFRGRGYARSLVTEVARRIHADGCVPFLTSYESNTAAIKIYEEIGFSLRRQFQLAVVRSHRIEAAPQQPDSD
jgi:predicted GNAT family acetyltransferase